MIPSAVQPSVSSSSTLWATASKEWVIPAKPKPGRKPKTEASSFVGENEGFDSAGRRVQNRAAQRAFRERKQSQLAELQARVKLYEQGEIERNVTLQNIAKRLKEENEQLRKENHLLKERISSCEKEHLANSHWEVDRKRWRDDSSATSSVSSDYPAKRMKVVKQAASFVASYASPPSMASSPDSNDNSDSRFPRATFESPSTDEPSFMSQTSPLTSTTRLQRNLKTDSVCTLSAIVCGFCGQDTDCFCREMALHESAVDGTAIDQVSLRMDNFQHNDPAQHSMEPMGFSKTSTRASILAKLPAYQPPIPLRRRAVGSNFNSVFPVSAPMPKHSAAPVPSTTCSGDPANCMACADDSFGQAFCAAIGESVATTSPCDDCPCRSDASNSSGDCCGDPPKCAPHQHDASSHYSGDLPASGTIPTNDAWRQIKSHPNVAFADLSLLADVVARRSKCTGPRVVISPAPGAVTPERVASPPANDLQAAPDQAILLTDPHAHYHESQMNGSPPKLVPQELLVECGRQRVCEVHADAVREALHLLDAKFIQS